MKQTALTILIALDPKRLDGLARERAQAAGGHALPGLEAKRQALCELQGHLQEVQRGAAPQHRLQVELARLLSPGAGRPVFVHTLGFFLIDDAPEYPRVVLEVTADGSERAILRRLSQLAPQFLTCVFAGARGFCTAGAMPNAPVLARLLRRHALRANAFYVAFPGRSVRQIRQEQNLRLEVRAACQARTLAPDRTPSCPPRAAGPRSLRLSPTSASAAWRRLQDPPPADPATAPELGFAQSDLVRKGARRPFRVRWSLGGGVWRQQLEDCARWVNASLLVASLALGAWLFLPLNLQDRALGFIARPEAPRLLRSPAAVLPVGFAGMLAILWIGLVLFGTAFEAPLALGWRGSWLVWRGALRESVLPLLGFSLVVGVVAQMEMAFVSWNPSAVALALLGALLFLTLARRLGLSRSALASLGVTLGVAALLNPDHQSWIVQAWLVSCGSAFLAVLGAFLYVMAGEVAAVLGSVGLAVGTGVLAYLGGRASHGFSQPLLLAAVLASVAAMASVGAAFWVVQWLQAVRRQGWLDAAREKAALMSARADSSVTHLDAVQASEDTRPENHLVIWLPLKPGRLHLVTLERALRALHLGAVFFCNRGDLGGIRGLLFARFSIVPDPPVDGVESGHHVLFVANYDGALGSLRDSSPVSRMAALGRSCLRLPRAQLFGARGVNDEQRFQAFCRTNALPSIGWYAAYPELSADDIESATLTREDLRRPIADPATLRGRLALQLGCPLSEADCDLSLRRL